MLRHCLLDFEHSYTHAKSFDQATINSYRGGALHCPLRDDGRAQTPGHEAKRSPLENADVNESADGPAFPILPILRLSIFRREYDRAYFDPVSNSNRS
jgi:hypothetical protein